MNSLRAFQVIGNHLSLSRAAEELHLTSSALSHQLLALEDRLGKKLFRRHGRGLEFTEAGRALHEKVNDCLDQLDDALRTAAGEEEQRLIVSTTPTFGARELLPRLHRLQSLELSTEIRISISAPTFDRNGVDCAIAYGTGTWPDLSSDFLFEENLILVCSPQAIQKEALSTFSDISKHQLLQAKYRPQDWQLWLAAVGAAFPGNARVLTLHNRELVIEAAESGLGLAVVDEHMVSRELKSGRLVQPWDERVKGQGGYYIIYPHAAKQSRNVMAFRDWLLEEFGDHAGAERDPEPRPRAGKPGPQEERRKATGRAST
ncbi:MAG TPA: LysR substrate-binding domain-containing protein [Ramlibacter sp.]|nr:LysR substrate-binding domain-containing protein [Ramlibacter sp.]